MLNVQAQGIRDRVARTLQQLQDVSQNADLQSDCATALASLQDGNEEGVVVATEYKKPSTGVAAFISTRQPERVR